MTDTDARPASERPTLPAGYGLPASTEGLLSWSDVEPRLVASLHYWLATVRPDGTPHSVPRWGVWLDGRFYYDGSPETRHARNLAHNPACTLTLESGTEVVIIEGTSAPTRRRRRRPRRPAGRGVREIPPARLLARRRLLVRRGGRRAPGDHAAAGAGLVLVPDRLHPLHVLTGRLSAGRCSAGRLSAERW